MPSVTMRSSGALLLDNTAYIVTIAWEWCFLRRLASEPSLDLPCMISNCVILGTRYSGDAL